MLIPCKDIAQIIETELQKQVVQTKHATSLPNITLVAYLLGESPEQLSFVTIKRRLAERLNINFDFTHYQNPPPLENFLKNLQEKMEQPQNTGVIIQLPLPADYAKEDVYETIPPHKEIEGHTPHSPFQFPLSLAVLTGIKYVFGYAQQNRKLDAEILVHFKQDIPFFFNVLKDKNIVIVGRGPTGGRPIAKSLGEIGVKYTVVTSETANPEVICKHADIIITATGKKIIEPHVLKKGVILLNVGLRKENGKLKGDYDEDHIKDIASYYTQTPGGLGPLDVLYLYKNLIDSTHSSLFFPHS